MKQGLRTSASSGKRQSASCCNESTARATALKRQAMGRRTRCTAWHPGCRPHTRSAGCTAPHVQTLAAPHPTHQRLRARSLSFAGTQSTRRSLGKHAKRIYMHTPASCAPGLCVGILLRHATTRQPSGPGLPPAAAVPSCGHKHRPLSCWHTNGVSQLCRAPARAGAEETVCTLRWLQRRWSVTINNDPLIIAR